MFVPFNVVQYKNRSVPVRKLCDGAFQGDAIDNRHRIRAFGARLYRFVRFLLFRRLFNLNAPLPKVHEHLVHRQPVEPGRESRLAAEERDFPMKLHEDFLCQVFRFARVSKHSQTERVDPPVMKLIQLLECRYISSGGLDSELMIARRLCRLVIHRNSLLQH